MSETERPDLSAALDRAAERLLKIVESEDTTTSLAQRVEAFQAIAKYHEANLKRQPATTEEKVPPFAKHRDKFNGTSANRRARNAETTQ